MNHNSQIIFKQLLERHGRIEIPKLQRDYAQGRPAQSTVRDLFLGALEEALRKPTDDPTLPLNLDFIYGSVEEVENQTRFLPLDGQQRLTTLFLLHWYLAWRDEEWVEFERIFVAEKHAKFSYSVRPTSSDFFDQLVCFRPTLRPEGVPQPKDIGPITALITDQPWYFRHWRLDPTIQSVLNMLDAIHRRFVSSSGLFGRLVDEKHRAITFQLLDLENFGLSDDLYIKMNARGKPLTPFETFKARYEEILKSQFAGIPFPLGGQNFSAAQYVAHRIDNAWADLLWKLRDPKSHQYDEAFMNLARIVALITRHPDNKNYDIDVTRLRNVREVPSYTDFHERGWMDERFTLTLTHLLDSWSTQAGSPSWFLPNNKYFDERAFFDNIALNGAARLTYTEVIQFAAYAKFIDKYYGSINSAAFQEWMRIFYNLSINTIYNRVEDFQRSIRGLDGLLENAEDILNHFAQAEKVISGFFEAQITEEKLKAALILAEDGWRKLIDRAEQHGYFRGQVGFLLDFCGAFAVSRDSTPNLWGEGLHTTIKANFERYLSQAEKTFSSVGLIDLGEYLWQRALLSFGDYLLPRGPNHSFLVNTVTDETSWKRLLRGTWNIKPEPREFLKQLWDRLELDKDLASQLRSIIAGSLGQEAWREALIRSPHALVYCRKNYIRKTASGTIYLLTTTQLNGFHAELFTYCLYIEIKSAFKNLQTSYSESVTYDEPYLRLSGKFRGNDIMVSVFSENEGYRIQIMKTDSTEFTSLASMLASSEYSVKGDTLQLRSSRSDIKARLKALDDVLIRD